MTNIPLSLRVQTIKPSITLTLAAKTRELMARGENIIDLTIGEPDFPTPTHVKEAGIKAINDNFTKYTAVDGIPSLKQAIAAKFKRDNNLSYELNQILVSVGAKHSLYNVFQAYLNKGDEVIIPAPYWVSYPEMVAIAEGKPVVIETSLKQSCKITPQQLKTAITPATKAIIINSPSNPSGKVYSAQELKALAEVLLQHPQILIVSDDIYEHIIWEHLPFANIVNVCPALYDRTVVVNGLSKAYAMTGWRIGYAAGPANVINAMKTIQSQSTSNPTSIAQVAAVAALQGDQDCVTEMVTEFKRRHDFLYHALCSIPEFNALPAEGAFYSFPDASAAMAKLGCKDDVALAEILLQKAKVSTVPGSVFGTPNHIRISYAASMEMLKEAVKRMKDLLGH
jgi:aspartate aminotransferase